MNDLNREILALVDEARRKDRRDERAQVLAALCPILTWLTMEPAPTRDEMRQWTLNLFAREGGDYGPMAAVTTAIDFHSCLWGIKPQPHQP